MLRSINNNNNKRSRRAARRSGTTKPIVSGPKGYDQGGAKATLSVAAFVGRDPFPPSIRRRFKYAYLHQLTTAGSPSAGYYGSEVRYNLNALYDPDYSGGGHQPYGYDQFTVNYGNYRVERAAFRITFTTPGADADILCCCSVAPGTSGSIAGAHPALPLEWNNATFGHLSSAGGRVCVLDGVIDLSTLCGVSKMRYDSDDIYQALISANPSQLALLSFAVASYSGSGAQACSALIEIEYDAVMFNRLQAGQS